MTAEHACDAKARPRVLVIEDEPSVATFMRTALQRRGYEVVPAESGAGGLKLLEAGDFQGIISDFRTPGGVNGADLHDWLTRNRPELVARTIFVTGDTVSEETAALLGRTGTPCVEKPFRVRELMAVVEEIIGRP
jgi:DNA-binding response OmpR family regulator